jgi:hypothetical protein
MNYGSSGKFQPGRRGGRKKGSKNKFRLSTLDEFLTRAGIDPHVEIHKLLPLLTPWQQASIMARLADIRERKLAKSGDGEMPLPQGKGQSPIDRNPALKDMSADQLISLLPVSHANGNAPRGS